MLENKILLLKGYKMTDLRSMALLAVKLFGLFLIVSAIKDIPAYYAYFLGSQDHSIKALLGLTITPVSIPVFIGAIMWYLPGKIANAVFRQESEEKYSSKLLFDLESIAISILGLYLFVSAASDVAFHIYRWYQTVRFASGDARDFVNIDTYGYIAATIVELIFSLIFIFRSRGLLRLLQSYRR